MGRLTRDGTAEPVSRDQILRHARGQGNIIFPVQLTASRIGNRIRLIHTLLYVMTIHTSYIHGHHIQHSMDQPGKVVNPARGQLNRENNIPLSLCVPENLVSRDGFSRPVPRQLAHVHTQAESGDHTYI